MELLLGKKAVFVFFANPDKLRVLKCNFDQIKVLNSQVDFNRWYFTPSYPMSHINEFLSPPNAGLSLGQIERLRSLCIPAEALLNKRLLMIAHKHQLR